MGPTGRNGRAGQAFCRGEAAGDVTGRDRVSKAPAGHADSLQEAALEAAGIGLCELDLASGVVVSRSASCDRLFGLATPQPSLDLATMRAHLAADDRPAFDDALERAREGGELRFEGRVGEAGTGEVRWIRMVGRAAPGQGGPPARVAVVIQDATPEKQREAREKLLLAELQHRVRNTLAMVRAIARRTADTSGDFEDFLAHLSGRIGALARVQGMATRWPWAGVALTELVTEELRAYLAKEGEQVRIAGPQISLPLRMGELLGLALHELAANAIEHGALSSPAGRIEVRWRLEEVNGTPHLLLDWQEQGVKLQPGEERSFGFGRELIERALAHELDAVTVLEFHEQGVHCAIDVPLMG